MDDQEDLHEAMPSTVKEPAPCQHDDPPPPSERSPTSDTPDPAVYAELRETAWAVLPEPAARVCTLRFGLEDGRPRTLAEVADACDVAPHQVWKIAQASAERIGSAVTEEGSLPALARLLGNDRELWPARAWRQAAHRERKFARLAEAQLLLTIAGMTSTEAKLALERHWSEMPPRFRAHQHPDGLAWPLVHVSDDPRAVVDALVAHTLWPVQSAPAVGDLAGFANQRPPTAKGMELKENFASKKLGRLVYCDSPLEHKVLMALDRVSEVL